LALLAMKARWDLLEFLAPPARWGRKARLALLASKEFRDHSEILGQPERLEQLERPVILAPPARWGRKARLAPLEMLVLTVRLGRPGRPDLLARQEQRQPLTWALRAHSRLGNRHRS
jgi:hypothetical protein